MTTVVTARVCAYTIALWMPSTDGCIEAGYISWLMLHLLRQHTMCIPLFFRRQSRYHFPLGLSRAYFEPDDHVELHAEHSFQLQEVLGIGLTGGEALHRLDQRCPLPSNFRTCFLPAYVP